MRLFFAGSFASITAVATNARATDLSLAAEKYKAQVQAILKQQTHQHPNGEDDSERLLQTDPAFLARYEGTFQELRDSACFSGPLSIIVACAGELEVTGTSDPNIACEPLTEPLSEIGSFFGPTTDNRMRCTCGDNCDAFVGSDVSEITEGTFEGKVFFQCSGDSVDSLYSRVIFEPTAGNGCNLAAENEQSHWHILQAGVLCNGAYDYDPFYFECSRGYEAAFELALTIPSEVFRCIDFGSGCGAGTACTKEFSVMSIGSDVANLPEACIETTLPVTPAPTPPVPEESLFSYTSLFSTTWGVLFLEDNAVCTSQTPSVLIECGRGSNIQRNTTATVAPTTTCTMPSDSSLLCTDSRIGPASNREFATVEYACTGPAIPTTTVNFQSSNSECTADTEVEVVSHILQLGIYCGAATDGYFYSDLYIECEEGGSFASLDEMGDIGDRYSCGSVDIFISGTTSSATTVPAFSASTDNAWLTSPDPACYKFGRSPSLTEPTPAPVVSPTGAPAASPTGAPVTSATQGPALSPTAATEPRPISPSPSPTATPSEGVVVANYKAEYTADFQHVLGASCEGPPPDIHISCTGDIRLVSTSLPSISCSPLPARLATMSHPNGLRCTVDCESTGDCDSFENGFVNILLFQNIVFECSGDRLDDIGAMMEFLDSPDGLYSCPNDEDSPSQFYIGRLGVSCGAELLQDVSYDHSLFECESGFAWSFDNGSNNPGNSLACVNVDNCEINEECNCAASGTECTIDVGVVSIVSDVYNIPEECVQGTATFTMPPSPSPIDSSESGVQLTGRFRTNWSMISDDLIGSARCSADSIVSVIQCIRSEINLLETATSVTCNKESDNTLRCTDSRSNFDAEFLSSVEYVSTSEHEMRKLTKINEKECIGAGPSLPETIVTLDESSAQCNNNLREVNIGHSVQLAPYCDGVDFIFFVDSLYVECERGNDFFKPQIGDNFHYSCVERSNFEVNSLPSDTKTISAVSIMTDRRWRDDGDASCFTSQKLDELTPTLSPRSGTTSMPVNFNVGVPPSVMVQNPADTGAPVSSPLNRGIASSSPEEESLPVGLIVGVSVGAIVFLAISAVVLFFLLWAKPERKPAREVQEFPAGNDFSETGQSYPDAPVEAFVDNGAPPSAPSDSYIYRNTPAMPAEGFVYNNGPSSGPPAQAFATAVPFSEDINQRAPSNETTGVASNASGNDPNVTFKDQALSMIRPTSVSTEDTPTRPNSIGVPSADDDNTSGITEVEADSRGTSDPSGIYSHERSVLDANYGGASRRSVDP